jgi:RNA polymerase sigma-70 factor (ECF subfamily)
MSDAEDFEAFVRAHQDMVYATALRLLGRPADAEDVAQTVFLRAFRHHASLAGNPAAPGWLKTVATNLCLNHLTRYRARWRLFSEIGSASETTDAPQPFEDTLAAPTVTDHPFEAQQQAAALEAAIGRLPDHQRVPLVLFHFEHLSYQEIAGRLGVSLGKLKTDIHRGRETLRGWLAPDHGPR